MHFNQHKMETEIEHIKRVSEKIDKILKEEGLVLDVQMIPQIRLLVSKPKEEPKDEPKDETKG